ncbi:hypothetical protein niasHT_018000 [Heterodera trifolii]|uniref:Uncharacterized protein n=1 Tax=Heterodera trifolii TaxID=157864 RepID=A0ABD2LBX7_9BILA
MKQLLTYSVDERMVFKIAGSERITQRKKIADKVRKSARSTKKQRQQTETDSRTSGEEITFGDGVTADLAEKFYDSVEGLDGIFAPIAKLKNKMNGLICPNMKNKPVTMFNSCQGDLKDEGVELSKRTLSNRNRPQRR